MEQLTFKLKRLIVIIIIVSMNSCKKNNKYIYYPNGNKKWVIEIEDRKLNGKAEEFYEDGKIKSKHFFKDNIKCDSSLYFNKDSSIGSIIFHRGKNEEYIKIFENGKLHSDGVEKNNIKIGFWRFYDSNEKLKTSIKYINVCGKSHANEMFYYDQHKEIDSLKGNYFCSILEKSKLQVKELATLKIRYKPYFNNSKFNLYISKELDNNFCNAFSSNITLYEISPKKDIFTVKINFSRKGVNKIRGFIKEIYQSTNANKYAEKISFIDIPVQVYE